MNIRNEILSLHRSAKPWEVHDTEHRFRSLISELDEEERQEIFQSLIYTQGALRHAWSIEQQFSELLDMTEHSSIRNLLYAIHVLGVNACVERDRLPPGHICTTLFKLNFLAEVSLTVGDVHVGSFRMDELLYKLHPCWRRHPIDWSSERFERYTEECVDGYNEQHYLFELDLLYHIAEAPNHAPMQVCALIVNGEEGDEHRMEYLLHDLMFADHKGTAAPFLPPNRLQKRYEAALEAGKADGPFDWSSQTPAGRLTLPPSRCGARTSSHDAIGRGVRDRAASARMIYELFYEYLCLSYTAGWDCGNTRSPFLLPESLELAALQLAMPNAPFKDYPLTPKEPADHDGDEHEGGSAHH